MYSYDELERENAELKKRIAEMEEAVGFPPTRSRRTKGSGSCST
jgi:hypothetical protein